MAAMAAETKAAVAAVHAHPRVIWMTKSRSKQKDPHQMVGVFPFGPVCLSHNIVLAKEVLI
jgi:hypothetical protein